MPSAAHSSNHGPGRSIRAVCEGVCLLIFYGGQAKQTLEKMQKVYKSIEKYKKSKAYKKSY